jgi:multisubunit Na+/H+ antiporter MnhG subunit
MLATRWAIAVPIAVLEPGSVRGAMRRSRAMLDGNGWNVFKVLFACWALTLIVEVPVGLASLGLPPFGRWITATLALALTTPFTAHALIVVYYALLAPGRPVAQEPGKTWESVWTAQDSVDPAEPPTTQPSTTDPRVETLEEEQLRKFEERERQWGG